MNGLGADFQKARESRNLEIADVARQLHIRSEFLDAIESETWAAIGDIVSTRGLLRTYARFLGLDGGAMVQRFNQDYEPLLNPVPAVAERQAPDMKAIGAIILGVVAIVVVFYSLTQFVERVRLHRDYAATVGRESLTSAPLPTLRAAVPLMRVTNPAATPKDFTLGPGGARRVGE